jgi:hypothetical protein
MSANTQRNGTARYAILRLRVEEGGQINIDGAIDLACEAMFLTQISHTNRIHLRGTVGTPGTPEFAIVIDRLTETLDVRMAKWKKIDGCCSGRFFGIVGRKHDEKKRLLMERVLVAFDLARALRYLHRRSILVRSAILFFSWLLFMVLSNVSLQFGSPFGNQFRDLKPENIGFYVRGKTFSFVGITLRLVVSSTDIHA